MIRVVAGVLVRGDTVLVCQRPPHKPHPGRWEFPGGKVEPGEALEQALERELREELAIEARVGRRLWSTQHRYGGLEPVELHFFRIDSFEGEISSGHFAEIRWEPVSALGGLDVLEADRAFVAWLAHTPIGAA